MSIRNLDTSSLARNRYRLIRFIRKNGDKRITSQAVYWLSSLTPEALNQDGTIILVYIENKKILALLATADYGRRESFLVVHTDARERGLGKHLTETAITRLGKLYGRVALDNTASLKTCLSVGMVGFSCITGVTGKPTLWLGAGDWRKEDIESI
ncbi:hypothetical protein DFP93_11952 [Aneurinibacillus soli]|uniref:Uncharacterized protein n=1 Tax=Aneurinibacillus soli TaxID=1500254 RepID=A0A0U4WMJ4_9BACL|nr:GNAT family N-acetyltransferase [Aneurinibacillus soli]PYE59127.1 hypothetical protein DFP93_11952 [Aneurinibacillus soli]BAU29547.1 hypothetical protein CB4_03747 [Aneurinibacillus soli]